MAENKTKETKASVEKFLNSIKDENKCEDCFKIMKFMKDITREEPKMWGPAIVGFGNYHYKYESGKEGNWFSVGFSPRKQNITLYIMSGFSEDLLSKLGKYKTGKSCLYIKSLKDVDMKVLEKIMSDSVNYIKKKYPAAV
ncbi:MAG: DUF1801 domain-containing protein [Ignavibacteria bacterium]|nr:DUF1801 domain-containing protein [Ignavibacteria bacterium]